MAPIITDSRTSELPSPYADIERLPRLAAEEWEGVELRLRAAVEALRQRANEGQALPRSVGILRAGARLPESLTPNRQGASLPARETSSVGVSKGTSRSLAGRGSF